jgi:hypothetical protein
MPSNPFDQFDAAQPQSGGPVYGPPPKAPAPPSPTDLAGLALRQQSMDLEERKFKHQLAKDGEGDGPKPLTSEDRGKLMAQLSGAQSLAERINEIEARYNKDFKGGGPGALVEYLPGQLRPANQEFNDAGNAIMGDIAAAYGLSAQQQNTPTELKIRFGPFIPSASDRDGVIEAKIKRLKAIAQAKATQAAKQLGVDPGTPAGQSTGGWGKARVVK